MSYGWKRLSLRSWSGRRKKLKRGSILTENAPRAEVYVPEPKFRYAPNQKEIDFAQLMAAGADIPTALLRSSLISQEELDAADSSVVYKMGTRLLSSPSVQERIDYNVALHKAGMDISVERIMQEIAAVSFADFALLFHKTDGPIVQKENPLYNPADPESPQFIEEPQYLAGDPVTNPHELPRYLRAAIKEWGFDQHGTLKVKFHDKLKGVQMLGDIQGIFDESNRAKQTQVNISIGDGGGNREKHAVIDVTPEAPQLSTHKCLD